MAPETTADDAATDGGAALDRRGFFKSATAWTAAGVAMGAGAGPVDAQDPVRRRSSPPPPPPPPNSLPPAMQFHAAPGGTGAFLHARGGGDAARGETAPIEVEPWRGERPKSAEEIAFLPVHRLAALIASRQLSPVELTKIYLERLQRLDPKLVCVVTLMAESARAAAAVAEQEIEAGKYRGPLHGIPWGAKDLFSTVGVPTTWGAKPFEDRVIDEDAAVVSRLHDAGAILIAKLSLGTFARGDRWYGGRTRNPWDPTQGSSGSSAGPASATAAGCVGFAIGTETRGSIVSPARRCGISALRPTFGRVSRHGAMTLSWSMDKVGPMCRTIEDCALVFEALHGADERDPSTVTAPFDWQRRPDLGQLRIGYTAGADPDFLAALRKLGAEPLELGKPPRSHNIGNILGAESAAAFDDFLSDKKDEGMVHRGRAEGFRRSSRDTAVDYLHAQRRRLALMREMATFMKDVDLYVSGSGDVGLTNLTGHPAAVLPYKFERGQPRCITLIGGLFADDLILSVAHAYQEVTKWHLEQPALG